MNPNAALNRRRWVGVRSFTPIYAMADARIIANYHCATSGWIGRILETGPTLIRCKRTHDMTQIENDRELRQALDSIPLTDQRTVGGLMVRNVLKLTKDARIMRAVEVATKPDRDDAALEGAYREAKAFSANSYTACGRDADWLAQAEHFVAAAATACLLPEDQLHDANNPAWRAAMQARMAKSCEMIESGEGAVDNEATRQYAIVSEFLDRKAPSPRYSRE